MSDKSHNLRIDPERLWSTLMETAEFGRTKKGGIRRLTLGPEDRQVRDWFRVACEAAGCTVKVDELGTMYAIRPGRNMELPPSGCGSPRDTPPPRGQVDGVLGTRAGRQLIRVLNDAGIQTEAPIAVVNWTNEEGSRFAPAMMASGAYVGDFDAADILARRDAAGVTVAEALDEIGYRGPEKSGSVPLGAFVELHIEQGPILEAEGKTIGVVERGQGMIWYDGRIEGFERHAGTTPMPLRRDALCALSEVVLAAERLALAHAPSAVATVGEAFIASPSRNVIPGEIVFTLEFRDPQSETLDALDAEIRTATAEIAERRRVKIALDRIWRKEPVVFTPEIVDAVENAAKALGLSHRRMISGAGHDACNLAKSMPTAMIFVPCKDGISHNEIEDATPEDCAAGANVLLHTVLSLAKIC
mgnify:CR=1 FL=1